MQQLSALELANWLGESGPWATRSVETARPRPILLDVRDPWEYQLCHLVGSHLMPLPTVPTRLGELDPEAEIVVICHHGVRSLQVGAFLEQQGFRAIYNLAGGIDAWANAVDPTIRKY